MKAYFRVMLGRWMLFFLLLLCIASCLVWLQGVPPYFSVFTSLTAERRVVVTVVLLLSWPLVGAGWWYMQRYLSIRVLQKIMRLTRLKQTDVTFDAAGALSFSGIVDAVFRFLDKDRDNKIRIEYDEMLPWMLVIGPSGAGKETMVEDCGLPMHIEERLVAAGIGTSVGDGRKLWFADHGVLIKLPGAGVFSSQVSQTPEQWRNFIGFLKARRIRRPLDAIVVVVDVERLMTTGALDIAAQLRLRLREASRQLGFRPQVYLAVSKLDLLNGFDAYFSRLDMRLQQNAMGVVLPWPHAQNALALLRDKLDGLARQFVKELPYRQMDERDVTLRARASLFPSDFLDLSARVVAFCSELMRCGPHEKPLLLRGVNFMAHAKDQTLSTKSFPGREKVCEKLSLKPPAPFASTHPGAFFIDGFFRDILLTEAGLSGKNKQAERRLLARYMTGYSITAAVGMAAAWLIISDYQANRSRLLAFQDGVRLQIGYLRNLPPEPRLADLLPLLDSSLANTKLKNQNYFGTFWFFYDTQREAKDDYRWLLLQRFLPVFAQHLREELSGAVQEGVDTQLVRNDLKVYLEMGHRQYFSAADVRAWIVGDVTKKLLFQTRLTNDTLEHVNALMRVLPQSIALDPGLIRDARAMLRHGLTAEQIYDQLRTYALKSDLPSIDVVQALGPEGAQLLMMRAQAGLPTIIPAFYTRQGFYRIFLQLAPQLVQQMGADAWVMGSEGGETAASRKDSLLAHLCEMYTRDYIRQWQVVIDQINLRSLTDVNSVVSALEIFSGARSPLLHLVQLINTQTSLPLTNEANTAQDALQDGLVSAAQDIVPKAAQPLAQAVVSAAQKVKVANNPLDGIVWPGVAIADAFSALQDVAAGGEKAGILQTVQSQMASLYGMMFAITSADDPPGAALKFVGDIASWQRPDPLVTLRIQSASLPVPLSDILLRLRSAIWSSMTDLAHDKLTTLWTNTVLQACQAQIAERFPFANDRISSETPDVALADFTSFFGNDGTMEQFETTVLAPFTLPQPDGTLGLRPTVTEDLISPRALAQINLARAIRTTFFGHDGMLRLHFFLAPSFLDEHAKAATMTVGNASMVYRHDPPHPMSIVWPSQSQDTSMPESGASLTLVSVSGKNGTVSASGEWAPFRLFNHISKSTSSDNRVTTFKFDIDGLRSDWTLTADRNPNPFVLGSRFWNFRCEPHL
ncbi:MAG: type VI secretion system membrane subunit TssM [Acetobacter sp.]